MLRRRHRTPCRQGHRREQPPVPSPPRHHRDDNPRVPPTKPRSPLRSRRRCTFRRRSGRDCHRHKSNFMRRVETVHGAELRRPKVSSDTTSATLDPPVSRKPVLFVYQIQLGSRTVSDFRDWTNWLLYRGGIGVKGEESWEAWWEGELS